MRIRLALSAAALLALSACAAAPAVYGPAAANPAGVGFTETRIEDDRWRVIYDGAPGQDVEQVRMLALRRAGELALMNGYDWFTIVSDRFGVEGGEENPVRVRTGVGMAVGSGGFRASGVGVGINLSPPRPVEARVVLEIIAGRGEPRPEGAYTASAVAGPAL